MSDKSRQGFVEKHSLALSRKLDAEFTGWEVQDCLKCEVLAEGMNQMLAEYDKPKSDRLARLKEFVERESAANDSEPSFDDYYIGRGAEIDIILAEMERLEKEGT